MLQFDLLSTPGLTYRELEPDEFSTLEGHPALNGLLPSPDVARIMVAERADGTIVGFQMAITVVHMEPIWVHPDYRGTMVPIRLWKKLVDALRLSVFYCFSDNSTIAGYLRRLGLRELSYKTFIFDPEGRYPH